MSVTGMWVRGAKYAEPKPDNCDILTRTVLTLLAGYSENHIMKRNWKRVRACMQKWKYEEEKIG